MQFERVIYQLKCLRFYYKDNGPIIQLTQIYFFWIQAYGRLISCTVKFYMQLTYSTFNVLYCISTLQSTHVLLGPETQCRISKTCYICEFIWLLLFFYILWTACLGNAELLNWRFYHFVNSEFIFNYFKGFKSFTNRLSI